jgi:hypothetical protein
MQQKKKNRRRHDLCTKSVATRAGAGKKELLIYLQDFRKFSTEAGLAVFTITAMVSSAAASPGLAVAARTSAFAVLSFVLHKLMNHSSEADGARLVLAPAAAVAAVHSF